MIGRPNVTHRSVRRLEAAIWEFLDTSNAAGKPFVWTKSADEIRTHGSLNAPCVVH